MFGLNQGSIYSILTIIFLSYYTRQKVYPIIIKIYNDINFFRLFTMIMSSQEILEEDEKKPDRKLNKEFVFDEKEESLYRNKSAEFFLLAQEEDIKKIDELKKIIIDIEKQIKRYESDDDFCNVEYNENDGDEEKDFINKDAIKRLTKDRIEIEKTLSELINNPQDINKLRLETQLKARQFMIDERLDKLKNSFVMEKTPLGNVLMLYNNKRGSFEFYSDNTIPYRYLEPVSRKYVKTFGCRSIYFDMEEELKNYEKKLEENEREKEEKQELEKIILEEKRVLDEKNMSVSVVAEPKKNVFAKFKSYNKEAGTGHVNIAAPPKNSIPNNKVTETKSDEKVLLKENANRYSYEGKLSNFNFLKKVDRKVVDKKFAMTFADFKRLQEERKK